MKNNKILIVSPDFPFPVDTGKKVVLNGLLKYLIDRFGNNNIVWLLVGSNADEKQLSSILSIQVNTLPLTNIIIRLCYLTFNTIILGKKSIQESVFYSPTTKCKIQNYINSAKPDVIIYDTIRMGQFADICHKNKSILYLDDMFSIRYELMLDQLSKGISFGSTVLGNFIRFIPKCLHGLVNQSITQKLLLNFEMHLVRKSEINQPHMFIKSLLLNKNEVDILSKLSPLSNIEFIPPYLALNMSASRNYTVSTTFIYLGALQYPPNEIGLIEFFNKGLEASIKNIPGFQLLIIGKGASERLISEIESRKDHVKYLGFVEDLSPIFSTCCAILLPIVFGTGVKLKALEAMSRGVPIVSTVKGIESVPVTHEKDCFIEDKLENFWQWMKLLTNPDINNKISVRSSETFEQHYSQAAVYNIYDSVFCPSTTHEKN